MTRKTVEDFLFDKPGYLKKSAYEVVKAIRRGSPKDANFRTVESLEKALDLVKKVQGDLKDSGKNVVPGSPIDKLYNDLLQQKERPKKILLFDLETSPNLVFSWGVGETTINHDNIVRERAIICIGYKWLGEKRVHHLEWDNGDDKEMLKKFAKIADSADILLGHNSQKFDTKWLRARCVFHGIPLSPKFDEIDTLKAARAGFRFNSNRLDYLGGYLGAGRKIKTDFDLWKNIVLHNDQKSMKKMTKYCKRDVTVLEKVYMKLKPYIPAKKTRTKIETVVE